MEEVGRVIPEGKEEGEKEVEGDEEGEGKARGEVDAGAETEGEGYHTATEGESPAEEARDVTHAPPPPAESGRHTPADAESDTLPDGRP